MIDKRFTIIAGARPNFMKIAPLMAAFGQYQKTDHDVRVRLVHTGQHYDQKMSETFFEELGIPAPDVNLGVGSGSHICQIAEVMRRLETEFTEQRPDIVVVVGDVNSTAAAAITANKMGIRVAHVEAGLRSFDRSMPEENNRLVTDAIAEFLFTSEPAGEENLLKEGVDPSRIFYAGNVMIDTLMNHLPRARAIAAAEKYQVQPHEYVLLTLHRPANVDSPERLRSILEAISSLNKEVPVIWPQHPRTLARIKEFGFDGDFSLNCFQVTEPVGYLEMLSLMDSARLLLTDSGGLQEESTALRVPCLTLRDNTERPITIDVGSNQLIGSSGDQILESVRQLLTRPLRYGVVPEKWDGRAAERIVQTLMQIVSESSRV